MSEYYESTPDFCIHAAKKDSSLYIVVLSPFLSIDEMMERKQQVADWLVKKGDLMIQKAHMFWFCVCWSYVNTSLLFTEVKPALFHSILGRYSKLMRE